MRILIISNAYEPEPSGIAPYTAGLARALAEHGHGVTVITANPSYPHWKLFAGYRPWRWSQGVESGVEVQRCPVFVPTRVGGMTRVLHYVSFALSAALPAWRATRRERPDVVLHVVPTMIASPVALAVARLAGALSWVHVQDFEVEAGFATGQMRASGLSARLALGFEGWCLRHFDRASSISLEMCRKLINKGVPADHVSELRNWADLDAVRPQTGSDYREQWDIGDRHVALYSGSIARKQGLELVLDAARALRDRPDLLFVICGNGPGRQAMEQLASDLPNVQFRDLQPKEQLGDLLALASLHLLPQKADAADLLLPSKLTNMLASGRPVIATAAQGTGLAREVADVGIACPPGDAGALASSIAALLDDSARRETLGQAARERAEAVWDRDRITSAFVERLEAEILIRADKSQPRRGSMTAW